MHMQGGSSATGARKPPRRRVLPDRQARARAREVLRAAAQAAHAGGHWCVRMQMHACVYAQPLW